MKRFITLCICFVLIGFSIYKYDYITDKLVTFLYSEPKVIILKPNEFYKGQEYKFLKVSKDFKPYSYQDLLDIVYTTLDSGYEKMTFYCPKEYTTCINDVKKISDTSNVEALTTIGNYVSAFNNFKEVKVEYDLTGEVTLNFTYLYTKEEIDKINKKIDSLWKKLVKKDMKDEEIIKAFHDYIINHTKYDAKYENELKTGTTTHASNKAIGPLFEGYAICSGYADVMSIVLDRLNIKNYKIASATHVWNALYINNKWVHLDATWDDPYNETTDFLYHRFYLIDTKRLKELDTEDHNFNKSLYSELK